MSQVHIALPITPPDSPTLPACDSVVGSPANSDKVICVDAPVTKDVSRFNNTMPFGNTKDFPPPQSGDQSPRSHKRQARHWTDYPPTKRRSSYTPYWIRVKSSSELDSEVPPSATHSRQASTKSIPGVVEMPSTPPSEHEIPLTSLEQTSMATPQAPAKAKLRSSPSVNSRDISIPEDTNRMRRERSTFIDFRAISIPEDMARKQRQKKVLRLGGYSGSDARSSKVDRYAPAVNSVEVFQTGSPKLKAGRPKSLLLDNLQPEYDKPHIGEPCTTECLDHRLECGHKVFTAEPEPCATNCHIRNVPDYAQPRDLDDRFVCFSCIVDHLQQRHEARLSEFRAECEELALSDGRPYDWVIQKIQLMSDGWRSLDVEEVVWLGKKGRYSEALWIDPEYQELVDIGIDARQQKKSRRGSVASVASVAPTMPRSSTSTPRRESGVFSSQPSSSPAPSVATSASTSRTPLRQSVQSFQSLFKTRSQQASTPAQEHSEDEAWSIERTPESSPARSDSATKNTTMMQFARSLRKS